MSQLLGIKTNGRGF